MGLKTKLKIFFAVIVLGQLLAFAAPAAAQFNCEDFAKRFDINSNINAVSNLPHICSGSALMTTIINIALAISGTFAVIFIILGGFLMLTSAGNEEQAEKGRKVLTNAVLGLVVIIMSFALVKIITNLLTNGGLGGSSGSSVSTSTTPNSTGNKMATTQLQGPSTADADKPYAFSITVPADQVKVSCNDNGIDPATSNQNIIPGKNTESKVTVTTATGAVKDIGALTYSNGQFSGSFTTDKVSSYGYGLNGLQGDSLHINAVVCGGSVDGWDIPVNPAGIQKQCDPKNNDKTTGENLTDCVEAGMTCNGHNQCVDISSSSGPSSAQAAAARASFTAVLANGGTGINVDVNVSNADKLAICQTGLISGVYLEVFVNGSSAGRQAGTYDNPEKFQLNYSSAISSSKQISVKICGIDIGQPQTVQPPIR
jgi:hypothetical protein